MALLHLQSFDDTNTDGHPGWSSSTWTTSGVRTGTKGIQVGDSLNQSASFSYSDQPSTTIVGVAWKPTDLGPDPSRVIQVDGSGGGVDLALYLRATGAIYATGPWGTSSDSATGIITLGLWHYLEIKLVTDNTTGSYEVKINGTTSFSGSSVDTQSGTSAYTTQVYFYGSGSSDMDRSYFDDFYLCDDTTSYNNDFLGDTAVHSLYPNGDGNTSNMTGSDADQVDNYELVNEEPPSSTDYVGSQTPGDLDTYAMENLGSTAYTVHGIVTSVYGAKSDVGLKYMRHVVRTGSTSGAQSDNVSDTYLLTSSYVMNDKAWNVNPVTGVQWTEGEITAFEVGQETRNTT